MLAGRHPVQRLAANDFATRFRLVVGGDDSHVELAVLDLCAQTGAAGALHLDFDRRIEPVEGRQNLGQQAIGIVIGNTQLHLPDFHAVAECGQGLVVEADHAPGIFQQALPVFRQAGLPPVLGEDRQAETFFQTAHLHGHG